MDMNIASSNSLGAVVRVLGDIKDRGFLDDAERVIDLTPMYLMGGAESPPES